VDLSSSAPADAEKTGIKGALLWPAAGLLLTVPSLILQWPGTSYLVQSLGSLLDIPGFVLDPEYRKLLLHPFIELFYVSAALITPVAIFLFFSRSRFARPVMLSWLFVGLLAAIASLGEGLILLAGHQRLMGDPNIQILEYMNHIFTWPSLLLLPVVKVPIEIYAPYKYTYVHIACLAVWLAYFVFSRRVASTFTR
jgi:hypothetical protein